MINDFYDKPAIINARWDPSCNFLKIQCPRCGEAFWFRSNVQKWNCMRCKYRHSMLDIKAYPLAKEIIYEEPSQQETDQLSDQETHKRGSVSEHPNVVCDGSYADRAVSRNSLHHERLSRNATANRKGHRSKPRTAEMSQEQQSPENRNRTLAKAITKSSFIHVQDAFSIDKVVIWIGQYSSGEGCSKHGQGFLDIDAARVIFGDLLLRGGFSEKLYTDRKIEFYGGNEKDGKVTARVLKFQEDPTKNYPIIIEVASGPGKRNQAGGYQPLGKMDSNRIYLDKFTARKLAATVLHHLDWLRPTIKE